MKQERKKHLIRALEQDVRYDGRTKEQFRDITIQTGISNTAEGSARVQVGETIVMAGVKLEMGSPYADTPDQGNLMVGAELLPLSSHRFEAGPPTMESIELARVIDRTVRESHTMDLKKLCITPGEKVWTVICDVCTINDAGNLFDTASIAVAAALKNARFPTVNKDGTVDYKKKTDTPLPLTGIPLAVTVWSVGDHLLVDPTRVEEEYFDARLTIGSIDKDHICALQKGGIAALTADQIEQMADISLNHASQIRAKIEDDV